MDDEAVYAAHHLTHSFALWDDMFEPIQRPLINSIYTLSLVPLQMKLFSVSQFIWGVGPWQQRVLPMLFGLFSLVIFWQILIRLVPPTLSYGVVAYFSLSRIFYESTHVPRPEAPILFVFMMNLWWLTSGIPGRFLAIAAGASFSFCFNIHPIVVIPLFSFILVLLGWERFSVRRCFRDVRYVWWGIGLLAGFLWYVSGLDVDRAIIDLQWAKNVTYSSFPICRYQWDLIGLLLNMAGKLARDTVFRNAVGLSIGLSIVSLRRFSEISNGRRFIATMNLSALTGFAFFAASTHGATYALFVYPWIVLTLAEFLFDLPKTSMRLDRTDLFIISCAVLFFMQFSIGSDLSVWLFYSVLWLLIDSLRGRPPKQQFLYFAVILFVVFALFSEMISHALIFWERLRYSIIYRPGEIALFILFPIILLGGRRAIQKEDRRKEGLVALCALALLLLNLRNDLLWCIESVKQSRMPSDLDTVLSELRRGKRIIGPAPLWLYYPSRTLRSSHHVFDVGRIVLGPAYNPLKAVIKFNPDFLLLDDENFRWLEAKARQSHAKIRFVKTHKPLHLFGHTYTEVLPSSRDEQ